MLNPTINNPNAEMITKVYATQEAKWYSALQVGLNIARIYLSSIRTMNTLRKQSAVCIL